VFPVFLEIRHTARLFSLGQWRSDAKQRLVRLHALARSKLVFCWQAANNCK
jgi:hypothetical protein